MRLHEKRQLGTYVDINTPKDTVCYQHKNWLSSVESLKMVIYRFLRCKNSTSDRYIIGNLVRKFGETFIMINPWTIFRYSVDFISFLLFTFCYQFRHIYDLVKRDCTIFHLVWRKTNLEMRHKRFTKVQATSCIVWCRSYSHKKGIRSDDVSYSCPWWLGTNPFQFRPLC